MPEYNHLKKMLVRTVIGCLLVFPSQGFAQQIQVFPPQVPGTNTVCPVSPNGYSYALVWDGAHNVECASVPTTCTAGQGLQFDGSNFNCVTPCSGPTMGFIEQGTCPAGEVGQIGIPVTVACDGTVTQGAVENTCAATTTVGTISVGPCTVGTVMQGQMQGGFLNTSVCITNPSICSNYTCEGGTWVASP